MSDKNEDRSCGACRHYKARTKDLTRGICIVPSRAHLKERVECDTHGCTMFAAPVFPGALKPTARSSKIVKGAMATARIVLALIDHSQWFEVTPLPDDSWEITVKYENKSLLEAL